jgi:pentose-5-phosphate-3-epimerase
MPCKPGCGLEVDSRIDETTARLVIDAGAKVLVARTAIFNGPKGITTAVERLRAAG